MNKLIIIGRACRDPEMRTTQTGLSVCSFSVAVDKRGKDKEKKEATFFRVTCWNKLAEIASQYITKGKQISVIGEVSVSEYDGKDGKKHFSLDVTASELELLGSAKDGQQPDKQADVPAGYTDVTGDDDLPF